MSTTVVIGCEQLIIPLYPHLVADGVMTDMVIDRCAFAGRPRKKFDEIAT